MKILISHSYFLKLDPKEALNHKPFPPLAPLYLIALIQDLPGIEVQFYDVMFDENEQGLLEEVNKFKPDIFILYDDDFNYLTKMCLGNMRQTIFRFLERVNKKCLFIGHGSDASDQAEAYLEEGFDFIVHRNAESVFFDFLSAYAETASTESLKQLPSVSFLNGEGKPDATPPNKKPFPLENMPMPAWEKIDLNPYRKMWITFHGIFALNISTSHGCPFRCNWCAKPLYGRSYKARPAEKVALEFQYLSKILKADQIWVTDDIFALQPGWISEFADALQKLNVKIPYKIQSRADLMNEHHVSELARSGCAEIWMGVESGSQKILDAMDKDTTIEQIIEANRILKKHGIKTGFFLQYGYPGEDIGDIKKTLELIRRCKPDHIGISVSYPLKGTPFYEKVHAMMGEKKNWEDSGDLALMYPGKFHPDFYRALHKYTHHYFGFLSLFRDQSIYNRLRRLAAQSRHLPGMFKYRVQMMRYTQ
ncbi:MAG: radical SAM protein [Calditrichaceae bacterium]